MANYLVVKFPNNRHSFTIKEEEPPKPYLKVKNGYLSLTTETSGGGFKAKLNGINYKIVETFTTTVETTTSISVDTSSTDTYSYDTSSTNTYWYDTFSTNTDTYLANGSKACGVSSSSTRYLTISRYFRGHIKTVSKKIDARRQTYYSATIAITGRARVDVANGDDHVTNRMTLYVKNSNLNIIQEKPAISNGTHGMTVSGVSKVISDGNAKASFPLWASMDHYFTVAKSQTVYDTYQINYTSNANQTGSTKGQAARYVPAYSSNYGDRYAAYWSSSGYTTWLNHNPNMPTKIIFSTSYSTYGTTRKNDKTSTSNYRTNNKTSTSYYTTNDKTSTSYYTISSETNIIATITSQ